MKTRTLSFRIFIGLTLIVVSGIAGAALFSTFSSKEFAWQDYLPETGVHAAATDRTGRLILATGYVAHDMEAVYCLDQFSGRLSAGVLSRKEGKFQGLYERNINTDLLDAMKLKNLDIPMPAMPQYTLVTGELDSEVRGARLWKVAKSVVYIAEANTGILLVYTIPWQQALHGADQPATATLEFWTAEQFQPNLSPAPAQR